jgi:medium-chain acyl-[acyl-carrier-protein] hydrolase
MPNPEKPQPHPTPLPCRDTTGCKPTPVEKWTLTTQIAFADVDRGNLLTLAGVFKLMQEVAIAHANHYDTGTEAMLTRGESWVLNRMAVQINRYPAYGEQVRVETWSSGIRGFKGYRDFRIFDADGLEVAAGSSLWLYVSVRNHALIRVPKAIADHFPVAVEGVFSPDLERLRLSPPDPATAIAHPFTLRYADFDANSHVNNTAYLDLLQSALFSQGSIARPRWVHIQYNKGIGEGTRAAEVLLHSNEQRGTVITSFSITADATVCALGEVR